MFIWEWNRRRDILTRFRELVIDYHSELQHDPVTRDPIETEDSLLIRQRINEVLSQVESVFTETMIPTTIIRSLPLQGFQGSVDLLANLFHLHAFQIEPQVLIDQLDRALGRLTARKPIAWVQTFNPLYWVYRVFHGILRLPFSLLAYSGFQGAGRVEQWPLTRLTKALFAAAAEVVTLLNLLEFLGYLDIVLNFFRGIGLAR